jgi:polyphosphate glucokinase
VMAPPTTSHLARSVFHPMTILMIDIGGSNVKVMVNGNEEMRKFPSGRTLTPKRMVAGVKALTRDWEFDAITLGFPGLVEEGKLAREPLNLSGGWLKFDFARAFARPVRIINDAAMQALANYKRGRMLFVGLGTSVGAALVADDVVVPVELGLIPLSKQHTFMSLLAKEARRKNGHARWQKAAHDAIHLLQDIFWPSDTVIGGGNAKHLDPLPPKCRRSSNREAIVGAVRLWKGADLYAKPHGTTWRIERGATSGVARRKHSRDANAAQTSQGSR